MVVVVVVVGGVVVVVVVVLTDSTNLFVVVSLRAALDSLCHESMGAGRRNYWERRQSAKPAVLKCLHEHLHIVHVDVYV